MATAPRMLDPKDLNDPNQFVALRVPVFKAHERNVIGPDGKPVVIKVDAKRMKEIAEESNKGFREAPGRLAIGHVTQHPLHPEHHQTARMIGFVGGATVEMYQGEPHVWVTQFARRGEEDAYRDYPYRSVDFDPSTNRITGVALLMRDPFLGMGATYQSPAFTIPYVSRSIMADEYTPEEEVQYAKIAKYFRAKYAKLAQYMDDPSSTNVATPAVVPATPGSATDPMPYQKQLAEKDLEILKLKVGAKLDELAPVINFDRARELETLIAPGMTDDKRTAHVQYMRSTYQAKAGQATSFIPTYQGERQGKDAPMTAEEGKRVVQYCKELPHAEALRKVLAERK